MLSRSALCFGSGKNQNNRMKKPVMTAAEAVADIVSNSVLILGGFGNSGSPAALSAALAARGGEHNNNSQQKLEQHKLLMERNHEQQQSEEKSAVRNLRLYTNAGCVKGYGPGLLFERKMVSLLACSHFGSKAEAETQFVAGELELEFTPQDLLCERMRASAAGIPAFYSRTCAGTILQSGDVPAKFDPVAARPICAEPKETRFFPGNWFSSSAAAAAPFSSSCENSSENSSVSRNKEQKGEKQLCTLEHAIKGDFSFIKAEVCDEYGNAVCKATARNFNVAAAGASKTTILEVKRIVPHLDPNEIHIPGIYVDRIVVADYKTPVENLVVRKRPSPSSCSPSSENSSENSSEKSAAISTPNLITQHAPKTRQELLDRLNKMNFKEKLCRRAALELFSVSSSSSSQKQQQQQQENLVTTTLAPKVTKINLGIGTPTGVPNFTPPEILEQIFSQTENGAIGVSSAPFENSDDIDGDKINAGKQTITLRPGAASFDSTVSFSMISSGKIDLTILGGMQVSETCDLANFFIPPVFDSETQKWIFALQGPGGAMALLKGAKRVVVVMSHLAKEKKSNNKDNNKNSRKNEGNEKQQEEEKKTGTPKIMKQCTFPKTGSACFDLLITDMAVFEAPERRKLVLTEIAPGLSLEDVKAATEGRFEVSDNVSEMEYSWI